MDLLPSQSSADRQTLFLSDSSASPFSPFSNEETEPLQGEMSVCKQIAQRWVGLRTEDQSTACF